MTFSVRRLRPLNATVAATLRFNGFDSISFDPTQSCHISSKSGRIPAVHVRQSKDETMQQIQKSYRGLSLLMDLNWDRVLYVATITVALGAGAFLGSL